MRHSNILENVYHTNFWFPLEEGAVHLHAAPIFFTSRIFHSCLPRRLSVPARSLFQSSSANVLRTVQRERVTHTVLVPTMINLLNAVPDLKKST